MRVAAAGHHQSPLLRQRVANTAFETAERVKDAGKAVDDLQTFGCKSVEPLATWEGEEELADATDETRAELVAALDAFSSTWQ